MQSNFRTVFGLVLILAGLLLGLQRFGILAGQWDDAVLTLVYGLGFIYFAASFYANRARWWAALGAFILLALALSQVFEIFLPNFGEAFTGSLVLFLIGLGFLSVYLLNRLMWWALIPAGVMFSLTALTLVEQLQPSAAFDPAGLLFIGMGLTFFLLYFLRVEGTRLTWAIFPAIPLLILGLFIGFEEQQAWDYVWPSLIILLGIYFLAGALRRS